MTNVALYNAPNLYINGLGISFLTSTTFQVASGATRNSTNVNDIILPANVVVNTAIQGINGLDQGTIAATTIYSVYAIGDSSQNNTAGAVLSLASSSAPLLPFGYDMYRLIGHLRTDGSGNLLPGVQTGSGSTRIWTFDSRIQVVNAGSSTSYASINCSTVVPADTVGRIYLMVQYTPNAAGNTVNIRRNGSADANGSTILSGVVASVAQWFSPMWIPLPSSAIFNYKVSSASDSVTMYIVAYEDQL